MRIALTCERFLLLVLVVGIDVTEWRQSPTDASKPLLSWRFNLWRWHLSFNDYYLAVGRYVFGHYASSLSQPSPCLSNAKRKLHCPYL